MAQTTFDVQNVGKPAPKWWRKLENGLLSILIPAIVLTLLGLGYDSNSKLILVINVLLVAVIKFVGYMLANGEVYALSNDQKIIIEKKRQLKFWTINIKEVKFSG
jgi:hypothetical protein